MYARIVMSRGSPCHQKAPCIPKILAQIEDNMATWSTIGSIAQLLSAKKLNDTMWLVDFPIDGTNRQQQVFLAYEVNQPDMEFLVVTSPLAVAQDLNLEAVLRTFGTLNIGSLSYAALTEDKGMLCLGANLPLSILDLSNPHTFILWLATLSRAADTIKMRVS